MPFNKKTGAFGDDKAAYETLARMEEHLKDNGVVLDGLNYRLGRKLDFRRRDRIVHRRLRSQRASHSSLSHAVRRARQDFVNRLLA